MEAMLGTRCACVSAVAAIAVECTVHMYSESFMEFRNLSESSGSKPPKDIAALPCSLSHAAREILVLHDVGQGFHRGMRRRIRSSCGFLARSSRNCLRFLKDSAFGHWKFRRTLGRSLRHILG